MKMNKKYIHAAVVTTAINRSSIKELAEQTAEHLGDVEVYNIKGSGFTLRRDKGAELDNAQIAEALTTAVVNILDEDLEEATDSILENYDFPYSSDLVQAEYVRELFDVTRSGRLIYIEIDL